MLREKYWLPTMIRLVDVGQCYECQVTTKQHTQKPLKMTSISEKPGGNCIHRFRKTLLGWRLQF